LVREIINGISWTRAFLSLSPVSVPGGSSRVSTDTYCLIRGLGVEKLLAKDFPVAVCTGFLDYDRLLIIRELEDNIFDFLLVLQLVVLGQALFRDRNTVPTSISAFVFT